ncbi:hypothetical protein Bca4012_007907 [Brassica carinata]
MSTFTMVHHTAPRIPFKPADEWNAAQAQLNGTVHCDYPSWIEILCHDIKMYTSHITLAQGYLATTSVRLMSLVKRTGERCCWQSTNLATWNWRLMKTIITVCHVYDKEENYIPFDRLAPEESQPITIKINF